MKKSKFAPEAIAAEKRPPEDAWTDKGPWTPEEFERVKRERPLKREISPHHYFGKRSLRNILPNRWGVAYQEREYQQLVDYKSKLYETRIGYTELKHDLLYKSFVLGYGVGPIRRITKDKKLADFIKYHCSSAVRLKALSLRAYEYFAGMPGFNNWTPMGWPVYLCLASAKSSLDSMAAVMWALLFKTTRTPHTKPKKARIPDMVDLANALKAKNPQTNFCKKFKRLCNSAWYKRLVAARNSVVHHGTWAKYHPAHGVALQRDLGSFKDRPWGFYSENLDELIPKRSFRLIKIEQIMIDFVEKLEEWERLAIDSLIKESNVIPFMDDGVIIRAYFNPNGPLVDFGGIEGMFRSDSNEFVGIQTRRAQRKVRQRSPKSKVTP